MHCRFVFSSVLSPKTVSVLAAALLWRVALGPFAARLAYSECARRAE